MKKNNSMRIAIVVIALTLITSCFVGTTFAKYTSQVSANDTAVIAKWDIEVNDTQIAVAEPAITFNLFSTIKDTDGTTNETDVAADLIAPGTSGSFALKVENNSEVSADYAITITESLVLGTEAYTGDLTSPIQYQVVTDDTTFAELEDANWKTAAQAFVNMSGELDLPNPEAVTYTIYWRWDIDGDDTAFGIASREDGGANQFAVKISANIAVNQAD